MADTSDLIDQTERLLARVEIVQKSLALLQAELTAHGTRLREHLAALQETAPEPIAEEAPAPPPEPAKPAGAKSHDRRAEPRRKGNLIAVLLSDAQALTTPTEGWVLDRSSGGLGIMVDEEVEIGTILSVRPAKGRSNVRWLQVEVKSCRNEGGHWNLGVQFVQKVGWNELRLFG
jgi:hypothetical protein